jgi:hypothetical protein
MEVAVSAGEHLDKAILVALRDGCNGHPFIIWLSVSTTFSGSSGILFRPVSVLIPVRMRCTRFFDGTEQPRS